MDRKMKDRKIIEFNEYVKRFEKIEKSLDEELETEIISIDEVREKRKNMRKKLEKLVLEIHPYSFKQMTGKDTRYKGLSEGNHFTHHVPDMA